MTTDTRRLDTGATWAELAREAPELASAGERLLGDASRPPILATVRGSEPPRLHPVNVGIVGGRLYVFVGRSAKLRDLDGDGRFALHAHVDPEHPDELLVRGRAVRVDDGAHRAGVAAVWAFSPDDSYRLYELRLADASLGQRPGADAWPPEYRRWRAHDG